EDFNHSNDLSRVGVMIFSGSGNVSLAELFNTSSSLNGAQPPQGGGLRGSYQVGSSTGRITGSVSNPSVPPLDLLMYAVSGSQGYAMQADAGLVTAGTVSLQH